MDTIDGRDSPNVMQLHTYRDVVREFRTHPEAKSLGPDGQPCDRRSVGLLGRRPVVASEVVVIGKEANELDQVETGLVNEIEDVQTIYRRDRSDEFRDKLRGMSVKEAMAITGLSRRQVFYLRQSKHG